MSTLTASQSPFRRLSNLLGLLFHRPPRRQVAALCYRWVAGANSDGGLEVLLITSRGSGRWIIPKGWPGSKRSARKTAKREAFEEAGIRGEVAEQPLGEYRSHKGLGNGFKIRTNVVVFPLKAESQEAEFPEAGQRKHAWLSIEQAAAQCDEPGLKKILQDAASLRLLA